MSERGLEALAAVLRPHLDPFAGRKLFHRFRKAGLRRMKVHMLPYHFYEGAVSLADREHWKLKFDVLRPVAASALGRDEDYDQWVSRYLEMLDDPDTFTYSVLFVVEGAAE